MRPFINRDLMRRGYLTGRFASLGALSLVLLCGCSRFGNPSLQLSPASFPECKGPNIKVKVSWDATSRTKGTVNIYIYKLGEQPTLFSEGQPKGSAETGEWMSDGSTVRMTTAKGKLLAMRTLVTTLCK